MQFPATELDLLLDEEFPFTKVILLFPTDASIKYFTQNMVLSNYKGFLGFIGVVEIGSLICYSFKFDNKSSDCLNND